jgi:hypothetical protein
MVDKTNVYFTAQTSNAPGGFVIDFRHVATGLVLSVAEGLMLEGLPEEMKMHRHPGLPGKAAWTFPASILQVGMALRRAGFASSPQEVANPREVPAKPEPKPAEQSHIIQLAPGIVMDMSGMMPPEGGYQVPEPEDLVFGLFVSDKDGAEVVYIKFADRDENGYHEDLSQSEMPHISAWEDVKDILKESTSWGDRYISTLGVDETKAYLSEKGLTFSDKMFFCHQPEALEFGVSEDKDQYLGGTPVYTIFVIPLDQYAPFFDDLRDDHLVEVPPYFSGNLSENTWELKPDANRDVVIADMIARGYNYNPDLDGELGG